MAELQESLQLARYKINVYGEKVAQQRRARARTGEKLSAVAELNHG